MSELPFQPNPEAERLQALADNIADGLLYRAGGPFSSADRLQLLRLAHIEASHLDASRDYLNRLGHIIRAMEALDAGSRRIPKRDARISLDIDVPRLSGSAHWPGSRAYLGLHGAYEVSLTEKLYERPDKAKRPSLTTHADGGQSSISPYQPGQRVLHQKFGYGAVRVIEGNKLLIDFEKAGDKRVIDTFVEKAD